MSTTFTYLPGDRPDGYDPSVGFGFSGNIGYWYFDSVAQQSGFTDHWLSSIAGGVRLNIGSLAQWSDETDQTDHYIDFLGADLALNGSGDITGEITRVEMGVETGTYAGDYFLIENPFFSTAALNTALTGFIANPGGNVDFYNVLTRGIQVINGQTSLDNHGGFAGERRLVEVNFGDGDDTFYWAGGNRKTVTIDLGDGWDSLRFFTETDAIIDLAAGTAQIGTAKAVILGVESVILGDGNDRAKGTSADEFFNGFLGDDRIAGKGGSDRLVGNDGDDILLGGAGNDTLEGGAGNDKLVGGRGHDVAEFSQSFNIGNVAINLSRGTANGTSSGKDTLSGIENIVASYGNDRITGDRQANRLDAQGGDDIVFGKKGNDVILGGRGNDTLTGGNGRDTFVFETFGDDDIITDFAPGVDRLDLSSFAWAISLATVQTRAQDTTDGLLITLDDRTSVLLTAVTEGALGADSLIFYV